MHIKFTNHAKWRIEESGVSINNLEWALKNPDSIRKVFSGAFIAKKTFGGKVLEVVYTKNKRQYIVITAYYL